MLSAFLAALLNPIEVIGTKEIFKKERVNYKSFMVLSFFFIFVFCAIAFISLGEVGADFFTPFYLSCMAGIVVVAYFSNLLYYYALSGDKVSNVQPISALSPIAAMLTAALFFSDERDWLVLAIASVAATALLISKIERQHLKFSKYFWAMVAAIFLIAIDSIFAKYLLEVMSSVALYTIRCGFLSFLLLSTLRPNLRVFGKKRVLSIAGVAFVITIETFGYYYAIHSIGIVKTSLIFLLAPVLALLASKFYLREEIKPKAAIADVVIILCVLASIFV